MKEILMMKGAQRLVDMCGQVKKGESVLVVADYPNAAIAKVLASAAYERGAVTTIAFMPTRTADAQEPPEPIAEAMKVADVLFVPVSVSITHTAAIKAAGEAGTRSVMLTAFTERMMMRGGIECDFVAQKPVVERVAKYLDKGKKAHLTTPGGTDLWVDIQGRIGIAKTCIPEPGDYSPVPDVEATVSPVEGSANGVIVADASIPYLGIGVLSEPVRFTVKDGFITSVEGGEVADRIRNAWKEQNDPNVYNVAELGIGLNPACTLTGEMLEDEGTFGTVHIGTGTSITLGGKVKAASHYDLLMFNSTLEVDGEKILENGDLKV